MTKNLLLNRDAFSMLPVRDGARAAMAVIDRLQDLTPEEQLAGLASAFLLAAEHYEVPAQDVFTWVNNIMHHAEGHRAEFDAVRAYMQGEW